MCKWSKAVTKLRGDTKGWIRNKECPLGPYKPSYLPWPVLAFVTRYGWDDSVCF